MQSELDLLGDPIDPGHGQRGRPRHIPTDEIRCKIICFLIDGKRQPEIAALIGVSLPTLRLNYFRELGSSSQTWRRRVASGGNNNGT